MINKYIMLRLKIFICFSNSPWIVAKYTWRRSTVPEFTATYRWGTLQAIHI